MAITTDKQQNEIVFPGGGRDILTANTTYYVRTDGNDSNTGLTDDSGGAFLTIGRAVQKVRYEIDHAGYIPTIQVRDGTYSELIRLGSCVGATSNVNNYVILQGNYGTPGNVVAGTVFVDSPGNSTWLVAGMDVVRVDMEGPGYTTLSTLEFSGSSGQVAVWLKNGARAWLDSSTSPVTGTYGRLIEASGNSHVAGEMEFDFTIALTFSVVVRAFDNSHVNVSDIAWTNPGNVTGQRFEARDDSMIDPGGGDSLTAIPGTTAGELDRGSWYGSYSLPDAVNTETITVNRGLNGQLDCRTQIFTNNTGLLVVSPPTINIEQEEYLIINDPASTQDFQIQSPSIARVRPGGSVLVVYDGSAWNVVNKYGDEREVLIAHRTYYVRTDGNDDNTGLVDNAGGAFLTIQKGLDVIGFEIDCAGYEVTLQVRDGTYAETPEVRELQGGDSDGDDPNLYIRGNTTTPGNVVVDGFKLEGVGSTTRVELEGFRTVAESRQVELLGTHYVQVGNMEFQNATSVAAFWVERSCCYAKAGATWDLNADVGTVAYVQDNSKWMCDNAVTIDATVAITPTYTVRCLSNSYMDLTGVTWANPGNVTGSRFQVWYNSEIYLSGVTANTDIPGTAAGSQDVTSQIGPFFKFGLHTGAPSATGASAGQTMYVATSDTLYIFDGTTWQTH